MKVVVALDALIAIVIDATFSEIHCSSRRSPQDVYLIKHVLIILRNSLLKGCTPNNFE